MSQIDQEFVLNLSMRDVPAVIEELTGRKGPSLDTIKRWFLKGLSGRKLQTKKQGGRRYTCRAWVQEFLDGGGELVDQGVAVSQPERPTPQKQAERASAKAHERAKKKLAAAGIL